MNARLVFSSCNILSVQKEHPHDERPLVTLRISMSLPVLLLNPSGIGPISGASRTNQVQQGQGTCRKRVKTRKRNAFIPGTQCFFKLRRTSCRPIGVWSKTYGGHPWRRQITLSVVSISFRRSSPSFSSSCQIYFMLYVLIPRCFASSAI
jgi:hypothetical protein